MRTRKEIDQYIESLEKKKVEFEAIKDDDEREEALMFVHCLLEIFQEELNKYLID